MRTINGTSQKYALSLTPLVQGLSVPSIKSGHQTSKLFVDDEWDVIQFQIPIVLEADRYDLAYL